MLKAKISITHMKKGLFFLNKKEVSKMRLSFKYY